MPITIQVESDFPIEVAENVVISTAALLKPGDDGFFLGFSRCVSTIPSGRRVIDKENPYCLTVNILEYDDEHDDLLSGDYLIKVEMMVFPLTEVGYKARSVSQTRSIHISN